MSPLILAEQVSVAIAPTQVLLAPVSFEVDAGTTVAVVGPNGSGKTTLLRVLAGLTPPTAGTVSVAGARVDERDRRFRARVTALIGLPPLARNLTVREHLILVATSWGMSMAQARTRAEELLATLTLQALQARFPHELSSGQVHLFTLTLTLARPFEVLLVDEPEQRLDPNRLGLVADILAGLVDAGSTLVVATHSPDLTGRLADQVLEVAGAEHHGRG